MRGTTFLLFSWLLMVATQARTETVYDEEEDADVEVEVGPWVSAEAYKQEALRIYQEYVTLRTVELEPGKYKVGPNETMTVMSTNYSSPYPNGQRRKWILIPESGTELKVECPGIHITPSKKCKNDRLTIFTSNRFRKGVRRCGRIKLYERVVDGPIKLSFKSNYDNKAGQGFICTITGILKPTTTTTTPIVTTTTHSPGCPELLSPPNSPTFVSTCNEIGSEHSSHCQCSENNGQIFLECEFCSYCDFNIFALHTFTVNVVLGASFPCSHPLDVTNMLHANAAKVVGLKLCVDEDRAHVNMPYSLYTALTGLYFQNCTDNTTRACSYNPANTDVCTPVTRRRSDNLPSSSDRQQLVRSPAHTINLPSSSDVPNLKELYLADVEMNLTNSVLVYSGLEKLCINSHDVVVKPEAFSLLTSIKQVYVEVCQSSLENDDFKMGSTQLSCLEINDVCMHNIEDSAIGLSACNADGSPTTITITAKQEYMPSVPRCPFYNLLKLDCVKLEWTSETDCRNCIMYWMWGLSTTQLGSVTNQCRDSVSGTTQDTKDYVTNNALASMCNFPLADCT